MSELCFGCMKEYENGSVCPHCGFLNDGEQPLPYLPLGTVLRDRYIVGKLLSKNAQGAEYLCYDDELKAPAVLREFLPEGICGRSASSGVNVLIKTEHSDLYLNMMKSFLSYFRTIARLRDISSIISIYDIFTDNNTAYTVEDYEELISFKEFIVRSGGRLEWNVARPLFMPLISSLEMINKNGICHLGISPDNVCVTSGGKLLLNGFMIPEMRTITPGFNSALISGCAAPEQYEIGSTVDEKADVYGLSAVLFYSLTGNLPASYEKRKHDSKLLISTNVVKRLPPHIVSALASGLQINQSNRISGFEELKLLLSSAPTIRAMRDEIKTEVNANKVIKKETKRDFSVPTFVWSTLSFVIFGLVFVMWGSSLYSSGTFTNLFNKNGNESLDSDSGIVSTVNDNKEQDGNTKVENITVPDFSNLSYKEIIEMDEENNDYNIVFANPGQYNEGVKKNYIIKQDPEPDTEIPSSSVIVITLSLGAEMRRLPDIKEKTVEQAAEILGAEEFVTYVEREYDDNIKEGYVIGYKGYYAGNELTCGSNITIIVSKGSENGTSSGSGN